MGPSPERLELMQRAVALLMEAKRHKRGAGQLATELEEESATGGIELMIGPANVTNVLLDAVSESRGLTHEAVLQRIGAWVAAGGRGPLFPST